jgi:superfamily II DNA or RNA helicase
MTAAAGIRDLLAGVWRRWAVPPLLVRERRPECATATPRAVALRMLTDRFGGAAPKPQVFDLASFQVDAVQRAEAMLAARRGAIVADDVGLGKTFVALALLESQLAAGRAVMVVAPAALRRTWRRPLCKLCHRLGLPPPVISGETAAPVTLLSHARLSLGLMQPAVGSATAGPGPAVKEPGRAGVPGLLVVDEAHRFRNPATRRYHSLAELCRTTPVVLLTATPVNNSPLDLYSLLRLFAGDGDFRDVGVADLHALFRDAVREPRTAATALAPVLAATMIRRTRPFIREHYRGVRLPDTGVLRFPRRAPPVAISCDLGATAPGLVDALRTQLPAFTGAAYSATRTPVGHAFERSDASAPRAEIQLLRLTLLKRLQSSLAAFQVTLERQLSYHRRFIDALGRGLLLGPAERGDRSGDELQLSLDALLLRPVPPRFDRAPLERRVRADLAALSAIQSELAAHDRDVADPKLGALLELSGRLGGEKLVVFTEFRATARSLWHTLVRAGRRVALLDGGGGRLGLQKATRRQIIDRFAPLAAGAPPPPPHEQVDVLVATDVLAEGVDLQDAAHVASYDLPWNPVRLVQRAGRIDRLGSPHRVVSSYYFLPDPELDALLGLKPILDRKAADIVATTGAESPLAPTASSDAGYAVTERVARLRRAARAAADVARRLASGDGDIVQDLERAQAAPFEAEERLRLALGDALCHARGNQGTAGSEPGHAMASAADARDDGAAADLALAGSPRVPFPAGVLTEAAGIEPTTLVACRHRGRVAWLLVDGRRKVRVDDAAAARILLLALDAPPSTAIPDAARVRAAATMARTFLSTRSFTAAWPGGHAAGRNTCHVASSRLLRALAGLPGGPDAELCRRADWLLDRLRDGVDAGTEAAIRDVLRSLPGTSGADVVLAGLEAVLQPRRHAQPDGGKATLGQATATPGPVVIAVLDIAMNR